METYTGIAKIDGGDSVYILGGPRIQVAQPAEGFTARFPGDDGHPICTVYCSTIFTVRLLFTDILYGYYHYIVLTF